MIMELALVRHRRFVIAIIVLGALLYVAISLRYIDTDHGSLGIGSDGLQYWDLSTNLLNSGEFAYSSVRRLSLHLFSALPKEWTMSLLKSSFRVALSAGPSCGSE